MGTRVPKYHGIPWYHGSPRLDRLDGRGACKPAWQLRSSGALRGAPARMRATTCLATSPARVSVSAAAEPNGIILPVPWPPRDRVSSQFLTRPPPAYRPPQHNVPTILINVGRQLFVDDFLIESTTLVRRWHQARVVSMEVLKPDKPWEVGSAGRKTARPFGGGSLLDPRTQQVHLWYRCGWRGPRGRTCVATSRDGVTFAKPKLHATGSNVVMDSAANEAMEVVYDHLAKPPHFQCLRNEFLPYKDPPFFEPWTPYTSSDGITWRSHAAPAVGMMADRSTFFLNPLRRTPVWAFSLRENKCRAGHGHMRIRRYHEQPYATRFAGGARWDDYVHRYFQCTPRREGEPYVWAGIDRHDCGFGQCDLYAMDGIAYESLILHGLAILHGPKASGETKNCSIHLGFSRDGFQIARSEAPRVPFIHVPRVTRVTQARRDGRRREGPRDRGQKERTTARSRFMGRRLRAVGAAGEHGSSPKWSRSSGGGSGDTFRSVSNLQLASGSPIIHQDRLLFYFGYGSTVGPAPEPPEKRISGNYEEATGLATLRRDGFASMQPRRASGAATAAGTASGYLLTKPLAFNAGYHLFVNLVLPTGAALEVAVLDAKSQAPLCGFAALLAGPVDSTRRPVHGWRAGRNASLASLAGTGIRLRFSLTGAGARLYAFWIASDQRGSSGGYLAGGELGSRSIVDRGELARGRPRTALGSLRRVEY